MTQAQTKKASPTTPVKAAYKTYVPPVDGYLKDNTGIIHDLSPTIVKALEKSGVLPIAFLTKDDKKYPMWEVDEGGDAFIAGSAPRINDCVYRAVKNFIEGMGLGTLTPGDRRFFETHPRVNEDGVNKANVLAVSHGLIVPWGLGITRIWVPKLSSLGDQHMEFAKALGVNPVGLSNYATSNADLIKLLELDPYGKEAYDLMQAFRFEFADRPKGPCVVMLSNWGSGSTVKTGGTTVQGAWTKTSYGMGHADFVGPRDSLNGNWQIAFEIGRLPQYTDNSINRYSNVAEAFTQEELLEKKQTSMKFSIWQSKVGGKTVNAWDLENKPKTVYNQAKLPSPTATKATNAPKVQDEKDKGGAVDQTSVQIIVPNLTDQQCPDCGNLVAELEGIQYCLTCNWWNDTSEADIEATEVCPFCYSPMTPDQICTNDDCGFDSAEWHTSEYFICGEHKIALMFHREEDSGVQPRYTYVCEECMYKANESVREWIDSGQTHPREKIVQIKEFKKK